jgi:hypothetical protein
LTHSGNIIRGRHLVPWRGLQATGAQTEFPLCGIYTFDDDDRLAGEGIYYDRATLLRQLGVFHEPDCAMGRITTVLTHPLTMSQVVGRKDLEAELTAFRSFASALLVLGSA